MACHDTLFFLYDTATKNMKHYDNTQWVDFVRGLVKPGDRAAMEEHLASGCERCARPARLLARLFVVAQSEANCRVPDYAVHYAKAIHSLRRIERVQILPHTVTKMIFDSFRDPLPAGIRAQGRIGRHTRYQAGALSLELRQESDQLGSVVTLVGQISNQKEPDRLISNLAIELKSGKELLATAVTNQFGEFFMRYHPKPNMRLYLQPTASASGSLSNRI